MVSEKIRGDVLGEDFKTTVLKMLRNLKGNVEKVKDMICELNSDIHKELESLY